jgi:DNA repair protein RadC
MDRIKEIPPWDRPREKLLKHGPSFLSDEELVALILGSGVKGYDVSVLSKKVLEYLREHLLRANQDFTVFLDGLMEIKGLGDAKVSLIAAMHELYGRMSQTKAQVVRNARDILPLVSFLAGKRQEHFVALNLNGGNRVLSTCVVSIGLVDQSLVHPREVFSEAVKERAARVIVCHNHPGGALAPSEEDIGVTRSLVKASRVLGIALLDHVIVSDEGYFSFREGGLM